MAECVDRGYQVEYSNARDEFILHGDMISYTFKRQTDTYGQKSKHYIADMTNYPSRDRACVLVETIAENMSCDITAHAVLLYVLFCLIYMYCTLYVLYILHTVHIVHVPCFPVSDVEVSSSTSVHTLVHTKKCSLI